MQSIMWQSIYTLAILILNFYTFQKFRAAAANLITEPRAKVSVMFKGDNDPKVSYVLYYTSNHKQNKGDKKKLDGIFIYVTLD